MKYCYGKFIHCFFNGVLVLVILGSCSIHAMCSAIEEVATLGLRFSKSVIRAMNLPTLRSPNTRVDKYALLGRRMLSTGTVSKGEPFEELRAQRAIIVGAAVLTTGTIIKNSKESYAEGSPRYQDVSKEQDFSDAEIDECLLEGLERSKDIKSQKNVVFVLGDTGAGKSTLIAFLQAEKLKKVKIKETGNIILDTNRPDESGHAVAGHDLSMSKTVYPELFAIKREIKGEESLLTMCDTPGFRNTGGKNRWFVERICLDYAMTSAKKSRLVFVVTEAALTDARGQSFKGLIETLAELFPSIFRTAPPLWVINKTDKEEDQIWRIVEEKKHTLLASIKSNSAEEDKSFVLQSLTKDNIFLLSRRESILDFFSSGGEEDLRKQLFLRVKDRETVDRFPSFLEGEEMLKFLSVAAGVRNRNRDLEKKKQDFEKKISEKREEIKKKESMLEQAKSIKELSNQIQTEIASLNVQKKEIEEDLIKVSLALTRGKKNDEKLQELERIYLENLQSKDVSRRKSS